MKITVLAGSLILALTGFGTVRYAYDDASTASRTLIVTVDKGETVDFDAAYLALQGATVTNVVKRGEGTLRFASTDIAAYTFDSVVEDGVLSLAKNTCITTAACTLTVCNGATFQNEAGYGNCAIPNLRVLFEGRGYNGMGALYKTGYDWGYPFGTPTLMGDALVAELAAKNNLNDVDLQGHTLDILFSTVFDNQYRTYSDMGTVNFIGFGTGENRLDMSKWTDYKGGNNRKVTLSNLVYNVLRRSSPNASSFDFPLDFKGNTSMRLTAQRDDNGYPNIYMGGTANSWKGPVHIDEPRLAVVAELPGETTPEDVGFCFENRVSGGGLDLVGTEDVKMHFSLKDGSNDFTGGGDCCECSPA